MQEPSRHDWRLWVAQALAKRGNKEAALAQARQVLDGGASQARAAALVEELTRPVVVKSKEALDKEAEEKAVASVPFPQPADEPLTRSLAAWVLSGPEYAVEKVNHHNLEASKSQQINMLFVPSGTLEIENGKVILVTDLKAALAISDGMAQDVRVYACIRGRSRGWQKVAPSEWARAAGLLGALAESDKRVAGLLLEIDPHATALHQLYAGVKAATRKPVLAGSGDQLTFKYCDGIVAKCFQFGATRLSAGAQGAKGEAPTSAPDLRVFTGNVQSTAGTYLRSARASGGKVMFGLPFVGTPREYEAISDGPGADKFPVNIRMDQYVELGLSYVETSLQSNDEAFFGFSIWAIQDESGIRVPPDPFTFFPSALSEEQWKRLKFQLISK